VDITRNGKIEKVEVNRTDAEIEEIKKDLAREYQAYKNLEQELEPEDKEKGFFIKVLRFSN
jgi:hypothetical protein